MSFYLRNVHNLGWKLAFVEKHILQSHRAMSGENGEVTLVLQRVKILKLMFDINF